MGECLIKIRKLKKKDINFFNKKLSESLTDAARNFFEQMRKKEEGEYAVCGDLILHYNDTHEGLYIVRYFFTEYRIGCKIGDMYKAKSQYFYTFEEAYKFDLFPFLDYHISLGEWLTQIDYKKINFNGNYELY